MEIPLRETLVSIYKDYAEVYDQSGQLAFSLRMLPYLGQLLEHHPVQGKVMLELACGTGTVAIAMTGAGWRVYGVDGSAEMLAQARAKAGESKVTPLWSQQDMRHFVLPERVSLATCLYDSLNYMLTSDDLLAVFRRTFGALLPGGLFLFDMNTAWALAELWGDEAFITDRDDLTVIFQNKYDPQQQRETVVVTCFQRVNELYRKIVERHIEQAYPNEQVATLLTDAGFQVEAQYNCFSFKPPTPTTSRIMWVARRPAGVGDGD
jgi:ubiquinone/menaquinone biosynthesis C-methylase UbiE